MESIKPQMDYRLRYTKKCLECGKVFRPHHSHNVCCTKKCSCNMRFKKFRTTRKCTNCKAKITRTKYKFNNAKHHFCGLYCRNEFIETYYKGTRNPNYKNAGWKKCKGCKKLFKNYLKLRKYCSIKCTHEYQRGHPLYAAQIGNKYEIICAEKLADMGYMVAKSKASRGPFDIFGCNGKEFILIQVKKTTGYNPSAATWKPLKDLKVPLNTRKQVWIHTHKNVWQIIDL